MILKMQFIGVADRERMDSDYTSFFDHPALIERFSTVYPNSTLGNEPFGTGSRGDIGRVSKNFTDLARIGCPPFHHNFVFGAASLPQFVEYACLLAISLTLSLRHRRKFLLHSASLIAHAAASPVAHRS
ncbi:hypothetical protein [Acetobacter estunensis]|uniref:hypothetical protein n=1 Tax=Acetobacter estunensis TaxID=104097 RepID=UPI001C2CEA23|nr:hypothetical protein [Acetobacter estunensis]MBV1835631.1 hypothetical protein [Acetobacter estunensis]MBV1836108.1 hypothetical protein [Acetobacter estunensis]